MSIDPNPATGTIDLDPANYPNFSTWPLIWAFDTDGVGIYGAAIDFKIFGTVPGGWKLYSMFVFQKENEEGVTRP